MRSHRIRILIADDSPSALEILTELVADEEDLELVGVAQEAAAAIELARLHRPDVALLDVRMPGSGPRAAHEMHICSPETSLIALSAYDDVETIAEMQGEWVEQYIVKGTAHAAEILRAIRGSARGQTILRKTGHDRPIG